MRSGQLRDWVDVYRYSDQGTGGRIRSVYTQTGRHPMAMDETEGREVTRGAAVGQLVTVAFRCWAEVPVEDTGLLVFRGQDYRITAVLPADPKGREKRILAIRSDQADYEKVAA